MRNAHPSAVPVVQPEAAPMQTKFGRKSKPVFKVISWKIVGGGNGDETQPIERAEKIIPPPSRRDDLSDEIPF
jgi:hypothetical protein